MKGATPSKNKLTHLVVNFYVFHWQDTPTHLRAGVFCFCGSRAGVASRFLRKTYEKKYKKSKKLSQNT